MNYSDLQSRVPSLFADSPSEKVSERYKFVSTREYLDALETRGWLVSDATQAKVRKGEPQHAKHLVTLRHKDHGASRQDLGSITPQIFLLNSHNGTSLVEGMLGIFRLVCKNGMMAASAMFESFRFRHTNSAKEVADVLTDGFFAQADNLIGTADAWGGITLSRDEQVELAVIARNLRFGADSAVDPAELLTPRRSNDLGDSLWLTFNRLQENITQGGIRFNGMRRQSRTVRNIGQLVDVNTKLWEAAENLALAHG
jgi:hypothetical protein